MTAQPSTSIVPSPRQNRSDFGLGASEVAAAIGVSAYQRPIDKWLEKTGRSEPFAGNEKTRWGNILEPVIRANYVELHGCAVHVPPESLYHKTLQWLRATPDGIVLDDDGRWLFIGPQVKNVGLRMAPAWNENGTRTVPTDYYVQGVVEMAVCDLPRIDFAMLLGGQEYFEVTIERDHGIEAEVIDQATSFWHLVESGEQPELDESKSFRGHLLRQIKRRVHVAAGPNEVMAIAQWKHIAIELKTLKLEEARIKTRLAAVLSAADASKLTSDLGDITVGAPRKKTGWKAIAEQLAPLVGLPARLERELAGMLADVLDQGEPTAFNASLATRIEYLAAQLKLAAFNNFSDVVAANTKLGDPSLNRPRAWTKTVEGDDDDGDDE